ncbi:MAG: MFS transporter, partial [Rhodobacterales bacterium]
GLATSQVAPLYGLMLLSSVLGGAVCAFIIKPDREGPIHRFALVLIGMGAWMDSQSSILTRPEQMFLSQSLISFASGLFLPPALLAGLTSALKKGPNYLLSFIMIFLTTQSLGGLMGGALFNTVVSIRQKIHLGYLTDGLTITSPQVADLIGRGTAYMAVIEPDPSLRAAEALSQISQQIAVQAYVMAYDDVFAVIAGIAALMAAALTLHLIYMAVASARNKSSAPVAG